MQGAKFKRAAVDQHQRLKGEKSPVQPVDIRFSRKPRTGERDFAESEKSRFDQQSIPINPATSNERPRSSTARSKGNRPPQSTMCRHESEQIQRTAAPPKEQAAPPRTGVKRKIQFARRSSGKAKITRVPTIQASSITTLAMSRGTLTSEASCLRATGSFRKEDDHRQPDPEIERQEETMPTAAHQRANGEQHDSRPGRLAARDRRERRMNK